MDLDSTKCDEITVIFFTYSKACQQQNMIKAFKLVYMASQKYISGLWLEMVEGSF